MLSKRLDLKSEAGVNMNKRIYLSPPSMTGKEMKYIQQAFDSNWIAPLGPNVDAFEEEVCKYVGARYGLALSSGTAAIHLALRYLGVGPGDYVFCSTLTFSGSCNPIMYQYANPVFIDSEPETWNMSAKALERAFRWANKEGKLPKAVIVVDLYGQSADYDEILSTCNFYDVPVIEDAAEALGSTYKGSKCGTFGTMGIFSFNGNKIITTSGGGLIVSDCENVINKARFWATQARENKPYYYHKDYGYNYRLSNVCAAIGRGQLEEIDGKIASRKRIRSTYEARLGKNGFTFNPKSHDSVQNYWLTVMRMPGFKISRIEALIKELSIVNIETRPVWKPMHTQPVFQKYPSFSEREGIFFSEEVFENGLCLPSGDKLTEEECNLICTEIEKAILRI